MLSSGDAPRSFFEHLCTHQLVPERRVPLLELRQQSRQRHFDARRNGIATTVNQLGIGHVLHDSP